MSEVIYFTELHHLLQKGNASKQKREEEEWRREIQLPKCLQSNKPSSLSCKKVLVNVQQHMPQDWQYMNNVSLQEKELHGILGNRICHQSS